jgi:uncharacterized membrane protein
LKYRPAVFSRGELGFGARPATALLLVAVASILLLAYFLYSRAGMLSPLRRAWLMALRCALFGLIVFCLMRPVLVVPSIVPQSSFLAVLIDDSASMKIADEARQTRLDAVKHLMAEGGSFYSGLVGKFKLRLFRFDQTAHAIKGINELTGSGQQTNLAGALEAVARDTSGLPLAAVVLISDGAQNEGDMAAALEKLRARSIPVFVVGVGRPNLPGDVELVRANAPRRALVGSSLAAELVVRANGIGQKSLKVEIFEDGRALLFRDVPIAGDGAPHILRISFTPSSAGLHRYRFTIPALENEPITENNSQELMIEVEDSHPKVLYVEGEPRWEYGKLRQGLADEKNVTLVSLLRSAEGKFYRQGVEGAQELASGFPKSEEELFKYDAVIIGSVEATFFTFDQLKAIEQFVSRRGGTLLALGGSKSFNAGGYKDTPLADLLPLNLSGRAQPSDGTQTFKAAPAERGRDHPAARLQDQPEANAKAWERLPAITLPEVITEIKPGAMVILEARNTRTSVPLLVEQRYGRGRSMALLASDTWRWRMMMESKDTSFENFWKNLLRYMVEGVRRQVEAQPEQSFYAKGERVRINAEVADGRFINIADAQVDARLTSPSGRTFELNMEPSFEEGFEGYTASFLPDEEGIYRVQVVARRGKDALPAANASFIVGQKNREAYNAAQNRELLKRIAADTGGHYYDLNDSANLIEDITYVEGSNSERVALDLWDMPINFILIAALAAAEWFARKRQGLA